MEYGTRQVLILFAHPNSSCSIINLPMFKSLHALDNVTAVDLYADYPDFNISIEQELKRLSEHDIVIFQFPLCWFSTPAILKEWQDAVLIPNHNNASHHTDFSKIDFFCAITVDAQRYLTDRDYVNELKLDQILTPLKLMSKCIGLRYLPPYVLEYGNLLDLNNDTADSKIKKEKII